MVWGGEGGHGAPQCDGSALICPVWPIHMCSRHCFHILNKNNVTQGNHKCSLLKSNIYFPSHLKCTPLPSFLFFKCRLKSDILDAISCSPKGWKLRRDTINRQISVYKLGKTKVVLAFTHKKIRRCNLLRVKHVGIVFQRHKINNYSAPPGISR